MKREVFHSVQTKDGWAVRSGREVVSSHRTQANSQAAAVKRGHQAENAGGLGQAVFHKTNGDISQERTYGADPKKTKG